jgi:hypothetical protein
MNPPVVVDLELGLSEIVLIGQCFLSVPIETSYFCSYASLNYTLHVDKHYLRDELSFHAFVEGIICD